MAQQKTGAAKSISLIKYQGKVKFDPPEKSGEQNDWILVLDDASENFSKPGRIK